MSTYPRRQPPRFSRGQELTAEALNGLVEYLESIGRLREGAGISLTCVGPDVVVSLAALASEFLVPAVVTAAYGATPDDLRSNVKYDVVGIRRPDCVLMAKVPDFGIGEDVRVIKAAKDTPCLIVRTPKPNGDLQSFLWMPEGVSGEKRAVATCSTTGQGGGGEDDEPAGGEGEETSGTGSRTIDAPAVVDQERRKLVRMLAQEVAVELVEMGIVRR